MLFLLPLFTGINENLRVRGMLARDDDRLSEAIFDDTSFYASLIIFIALNHNSFVTTAIVLPSTLIPFFYFHQTVSVERAIQNDDEGTDSGFLAKKVLTFTLSILFYVVKYYFEVIDTSKLVLK